MATGAGGKKSYSLAHVHFSIHYITLLLGVVVSFYYLTIMMLSQAYERIDFIFDKPHLVTSK